MHRGSHHFGIPYDSAYSRRGYKNEDNMIEIVQQFREFKPYLKKRLAYIRQSGRALELQDEVEDIEFYLEVMKDILADESHGVDQLRSFIDKIHEMIRKNPLTELPTKSRRSLDGREDEFGDNDRPRSPSPETRGSDTAANIPLIPTHGAHRTVEVNFSQRNEHSKSSKVDDGYDEWGRSTFEDSFTRREPYKDVDMRGGGYYPGGGIGRGQRRWSEENDYGGAHGRGMGVGRGLGIGRGGSHHRQDQDVRNSRGRGYNDNDFDRRNDYFLDRNRTRDHSKERERDFKPPDWLTGGGPSNGTDYDEWQPKNESRDNCFRPDVDRRNRDEEWRMNHNHNEARDREEKYHHAQHIAKYFERRPSSEARREERNDDYISMFDRRSRNERSYDSLGSRHDMGSPHNSDYNHGRRGHADFHGRDGRGRKEDDRHEARSRMDGGQQFPPSNTAPPMTSIPINSQSVSMGYNVPQPPPHYTNTGLLPPPSPFTNVNPPLLPLPVPNAPHVGMGLGMQNVAPPQMAPGVAHSMGFQQPPPSASNFSMTDMHSNPSGYRLLPPPHPPHQPHSQSRPSHSPSPMRTSNPHHPPEHYQGVPSGSPNYASPVEPSAEQVREITMMKAKQCFGRIVSRPSTGGASTQSPTQGSSTMTSVSPGPNSPNNSGADNQNPSALDPRLNRARSGPHHTVQSRQQSPTSVEPPPRSNQPSSRPDAGNVLRPTSDPRARSRIEQERKRLQETRERIQHYVGSKSNSNNNKASKIQELRKQFEKEGFHRLGRPAPKKQSGSFEDAITVTYDDESDSANSKSGDKSRPSSSSSHAKEKESDSGSQSRSQTDKTERDKSPKRKGGDKAKIKEKTNSKNTNSVDKKKEKEITNDRSPRRRPLQNDKTDKTTDKIVPNSSKSTKDSETAETTEKTIDPTKPPSFKIPRKPKPKEPEVETNIDEPATEAAETPETSETSETAETAESTEKDVCTSPPASPEPALSQVPDLDNRTENADDGELPSSSTKPPATEESGSSSDDINPNALEKLKQFLMTSADPDERDFFMSDPDTLKQFFFKIKSEMSAAKVNRSDNDSSSNQVISGDADSDKNQPPEEDLQERGRSREKKRNTKRRSSLEKLHDALKEMRFDTMLPLGPRRCTRGGQDEAAAAAAAAAAESVAAEPEVTAPSPEEMEEVKINLTNEELDDEEEKSQPTKKRGRPPKESPKSKRSATKASPDVEENEVEAVETEKTEVESEEKVTVRRGKKRKLKPTKVNARKRAKKSGPITRAQAALKNKGKSPFVQSEENVAQKSEGVTTRKKKKAASNVILRRLTRKRVGANDTVVNKGLCKIKLESDYLTSIKTETSDMDLFLNTDSVDDINEQPYLADQLANIINENLDNVVAHLDKQTEEIMDLDVFNTFDADDNAAEACIKNEMSINLESEEVPEPDFLNEDISEPPMEMPSRSELVQSISLIQAAASENNKDSDDMAPFSTFRETSLLGFSSTQRNIDKDEFSRTASCSQMGGEKRLGRLSGTSMLSEEVSAAIQAAVTINGANASRKAAEMKERALIRDADSSSANSSLDFGNGMLKREMSSFIDYHDDEFRRDSYSNRCDKCNFAGKKIVAHYVNKHYPCNIPQARLMPETFNGLIELNTSESPQLLEIVLDESQSQVWPCLYCDDRYNCIVDFYDHLTSHTGEFRYECGECGSSYPYHKSLLNHVKIHKGVAKHNIRFSFESVIEKKSNELSGFLCNDCYYFQLRFESIIRHIEQSGHSTLDVKSVRLIRPSAHGSADVKVKAAGRVVKVEEGETASTKVKVEASEHIANYASESSRALVSENENERVFFGSNVNFTPPVLSSGDCSFPVPRVFEENFLNDLMQKVADGSETGSRYVAEGNRKRKRSKSCTGKAFSTFGESENNLSPDSTTHRRTIRTGGVKIRRTYPKPKTSLEWDSSSEDSFREEMNDFFLSSDDDSDDSESSDESCYDDATGKPAVKYDFEGIINNENSLKTVTLPKTEPWDESYFVTRNMEVVRRPGDLYNPNTVLFGYIRPGTSRNAPHKLRDQKEVEKLNQINGVRVLPVKCLSNLEEMLTTKKLTHFFKCMGTLCSYTTDDSGAFQNHLSHGHYSAQALHRKHTCSRFLPTSEVLRMKDSDCCSYCSARYKDSRDLVEHIINQHSQSQFQCGLCFYRSFYHRYVARHFEVDHNDEEAIVLKSERMIDAISEEATLFQIFVYKCQINNPTCDKTKRYVFREDFIDHLENCGAGHEAYPCHLCKKTFPLEYLIEHYKTHNLFKFHCSYCSFGSEVKTDLDEHFVFVHPNTSGRVFYRVKPPPTSTAPKPIFPALTKKKKPTYQSSLNQSNSPEKEGAQQDPQVNAVDSTGMDVSENEDAEKGRVTNLRGRDLYQCVTGDCEFVADTNEIFKEHVNTCAYVAESRSLSCAHCERKMKTGTNLLEHMKVHGEKKQSCSLCNFRCWTSTEITKHIKTFHRVMSHKLIKKDVNKSNPDPDYMAYPKDVMTKSLCTVDNFDTNYYSFAKKATYSYDNVEKLPLNKIFSSELYCAICPYSTKVRSNMIRHIEIHKLANKDGTIAVPLAQRINPVPYLSREGLEFDKMMNLAASSHKTDGTAAESDVKKLPQFVKEQFRYVCGICDHITSDDALLQTHIKVIHNEVTLYKCPHCAKNPESKNNPDNTVTLDKIAFHLRLHGPKLYKCGHCMVVHHQPRLMEKHIPEKHPEKKPIHYLIRDLDPDGVPSARPSTSGVNRRQSVDDSKKISSEKWKCFLCSSKTIFGSWDDAKTHCETVHKVMSQFMCLLCGRATDDVKVMRAHCYEKCCDEEKKKKILVMFSKCETYDAEDATQTAPIWKKNAGPVRHIHGNFTEDSVALIKQYNNQQGEPLPTSTLSPLRSASTLPVPTKNQMKPQVASTSKARRSTGGSSPTKSSPMKSGLGSSGSPLKLEVFKFRCHKCDMYKTKSPSELRIHLFNEFRYKRWVCLICNTKFTTEKSLKGHIERDHQRVYQPDLYYLQPENIEIEGEIDECIEKQNRKREMIHSFSYEKLGRLTCKHCNEDGYTYDSFETHILQRHSS